MATDINLSQLVINKLTKAQYKAAKDAGSIVETELYMIADESEDVRIAASVTLSATNWSGLTQSVVVSGVTANSIIIVTPAPDSYEVYGEFGVYCSAQADDALTFKCSTVPSTDLIVNVLALN